MPGVGGGGQLEMMAASTGGLFQGQSDTALFISNIWVHKAIETETGISSMTIPYEILKSNPNFFFLHSTWISEYSQAPRSVWYPFLNMN